MVEILRAQQEPGLRMRIAALYGDLRGGGASDAVLEEGDELLGIAGGGKAGLAGANDSEGLAGGEMRKSLF